MTMPTEADIAATASLLDALGHPGRLSVVLALHTNGALSVSALCALVGLEQSAMSHQLRVLRDARLVQAQRQGKQMLYSLHDHHVAHIVADALSHIREN
ncbi:MAG: helix-turn-helix transcriptional regulator [Proteobacteria bacterium]|nr:helix-turn-helix transcriptional regulator [Pseudomonadota bacterium]